jgi:hypothetical protein
MGCQQTPESHRQAAFAAHTQIHCNRPARETLEWLMEHHGFTRKELMNAWKCNTVFWSETEKKVQTKLNRFIYWILGWGGVWSSVAVLVCSFLSISIGLGSNLKTLAVYCAALPVFLFPSWFSMTLFIQPFRTGQRVRQALETQSRLERQT